MNIVETRKSVFNRDGWRCCRCGMRNGLQLAHRIAQTKGNIKYIMGQFGKTKKQAEEIIHHPLNLRASCADCNSYFNIGNRPMARDYLLIEIIEELKSEVS